MNADVIKKLAICAVGTVIGAGAGYALATFIYENTVTEEEYYEDEEEPAEEEDIETVLPATKMKDRKKKKVDYTSMYQGKTKPDLDSLAKRLREEIEADEEEHAEEIVETPIDPTRPYIISREAFEEEMLQAHQKVYYHYYEEDDILTQAEDEMIITANSEKFLGPDALDSFGKDELDPDFVHIRNELLATDYEVQVIHSSFEKVISGQKKQKTGKPAKRQVEKQAAEEEEDDE